MHKYACICIYMCLYVSMYIYEEGVCEDVERLFYRKVYKCNYI